MPKGRARRHRAARQMKHAHGGSVDDVFAAVECVECGRSGEHASWCLADDVDADDVDADDVDASEA